MSTTCCVPIMPTFVAQRPHGAQPSPQGSSLPRIQCLNLPQPIPEGEAQREMEQTRPLPRQSISLALGLCLCFALTQLGKFHGTQQQCCQPR